MTDVLGRIFAGDFSAAFEFTITPRRWTYLAGLRHR